MKPSALLRILLPVLLLALNAFAQRDLATLVGTVTDPAGAGIPSAKVTISEDATGLKYDVVTTGGGEYARPALKPGIYSVTVEAAGFKKSTRRNIPLTAGDRTSIVVPFHSPVLTTSSVASGARGGSALSA